MLYDWLSFPLNMHRLHPMNSKKLPKMLIKYKSYISKSLVNQDIGGKSQRKLCIQISEYLTFCNSMLTNL